MTEKILPRVIIAGTSSGSGKTTVTCALLELLLRRGIKPSAFKCGPDYIDPMFHSSVIGVDSANLDPFFCGENLLRFLMAKNSRDSGVAVVEGVMGYYDGTGESGVENSTFTVAQETLSPVLLCVNGRGAAASLMAQIKGFTGFLPQNQIRGVIFNGVSAGTYENLKRLTRRYFGVEVAPLGYLPQLPDGCLLESRHLGLVTAAEIGDLQSKLNRLADIAQDTLDVDSLLKIADSAVPLRCEPPEIPRLEPVKLAVARDKAFCFSYQTCIGLLCDMGAEIEYFSPLADEPVPDGCQGLYLCGGYPELYADVLERAETARESVRAAVASGMPTIAECGGFMYLGKSLGGREMCGALGHESENRGRLVRFGYVSLTAKSDCLFGAAGTVLAGHEFHYFDSTVVGGGFTAKKTSGKTYDCAVLTETLYAGYPHLYLYSNIDAAAEFYRGCLRYKARLDK